MHIRTVCLPKEWSLLRQNYGIFKTRTDLPGKTDHNCQENHVPQIMPAIWDRLSTHKVCVSREHNITERIESLFVFSIHKSFQELNCSLKILNCGWMTVLVSYKPHQEKSPKRELKVLWWVSKQLHTWSLFREARVKKWDASDVEGPKAGEKQKIHFWRSFTYLQWLLCCSSVLLLQASLLHLKSIH